MTFVQKNKKKLMTDYLINETSKYPTNVLIASSWSMPWHICYPDYTILYKINYTLSRRSKVWHMNQTEAYIYILTSYL